MGLQLGFLIPQSEMKFPWASIVHAEAAHMLKASAAKVNNNFFILVSLDFKSGKGIIVFLFLQIFFREKMF